MKLSRPARPYLHGTIAAYKPRRKQAWTTKKEQRRIRATKSVGDSLDRLFGKSPEPEVGWTSLTRWTR